MDGNAGGDDQQHRENRTFSARDLRALAHPLRLRLLESLRMDGPATAARLAARLGESAANLSWHLRKLAEHGFIAPDDEHGDRRERWWRAVDQYTTITEADYLGESDLRQARDALTTETLARQFDRANAFVRQDWPDEWRAVSAIGHWMLLLSPDELLELGKEVTEVIERYEQRGTARVPGDHEEQVLFQLQVFPRKRGGQR
ncbi:helix-turn-helix domain-containing protein [Amycolatopsis taiwanensis]|uniref:helix-turn-helix domain-containing protein n=1 Tax=Amycolatopsis taiwanensis TaxID=342230 RepID=UPI0004B7370B|nr:helix-turn-helix domain-containing protein [Amycolatopsis taiwanensis]